MVPPTIVGAARSDEQRGRLVGPGWGDVLGRGPRRRCTAEGLARVLGGLGAGAGHAGGAEEDHAQGGVAQAGHHAARRRMAMVGTRAAPTVSTNMATPSRTRFVVDGPPLSFNVLRPLSGWVSAAGAGWAPPGPVTTTRARAGTPRSAVDDSGAPRDRYGPPTA